MADTTMSLRQMIEGMTLIFDPEAAHDLRATIQFRVSGPDERYYLKIAEQDCTFHLGKADLPDLTIITPADVWLKISRGEQSGRDALLEGLYRVEGNGDLLLRFAELFNESKAGPIERPDRKPPGPLPLGGMAWLQVGFIPWILFWIFFKGAFLSVGFLLPLLLSLSIVIYRSIYHESTFMEKGSLVFFIIGWMMMTLNPDWLSAWGSVIGSLYIGGLWFASVPLRNLPLCGEYSRWGYIEKLARTSLFIHPNAVISLAWGCQFLVSALVGVAACFLEPWRIPLTILRYLLLVPAILFTNAYIKGAENRMLPDIDRSLARMRFWGWAGLFLSAAMVVSSLLWPIPI